MIFTAGQNRHKSIYKKKILLTYFSVMLIPLLFLNVTVYILLKNHAYLTANNHNEQTMNRILNSFDSEINRMSHVATDISKSLLIRKSSLDTSMVNVLKSQKTLSSYVAANQFFTDLLYYPRDELTFYGSQSVYDIRTIQNYYFNSFKRENYLLFKNINSVEEASFINWGDTNTALSDRFFTYIIPLRKTTDQDAMILFMIPKENMYQKILNERERDGFPLILADSHGQLVFTNISDRKSPAFAAWENISLSQGEMKGIHKRGGYLVNIHKSKETAYSIIRMVPLNNMRHSILQAGLLILALSVGILLFELLIITYSLKITYNPIRNLAESFRKDQNDQPITDALAFLQKEVDFLQNSQFSALLDIGIRDFFSQLYDNNFRDEQEIQDKAAAIGLSRDKRWVNLISLEVTQSDGTADPHFHRMLQEHFIQMIPAAYPSVCRYEPLIGNFYCIFQSDSPNTAQLKESILSSIEQLEEEFMVRINLHWTPLKKGLLSLNTSVKEIMRGETLTLDESRVKTIESCLVRHDFNTMREELTSLLNEYAHGSSEQLRFLYFRLFTLYTNRIPEEERNSWLMEYSVLPDEQGQERICRRIEEMTSAALIVIKRSQKQNLMKTRLVDRIKDYVDENALSADFSVALAADQFSIARSTISGLFRRQFGVGIAQYVGDLRIRRAEALLKQGYPVKEVVGLIGYQDTTSFIKKFKKNLGITPGEYAENLKDVPKM